MPLSTATTPAAIPAAIPATTPAASPALPTALSPRAPALARQSSGLLLALFFIVLLIPVNLEVAGLKLSPYRIYLLVLFIPLGVRLLAGGAGRVTPIDIGMSGYALLMMVTLIYHHGVEKLPYASVLAIEMFGSYVLGRILIRNAADYQRFIRCFLWTLLLLSPLALYELLSSRMPLAELFDRAFSVTKKNIEFRYGLSRVQVAFPHSILYGLFCSLALASTYHLYRSSVLRALPRMALVIGMTVMSLSSAPMLSVLIQTLMIVWDKITRGNWKLLAGLVAGMYLFLEIFSNRGPVVIFIQNLTLDPNTGWTRIYIWRYGSASVLQNPLMGIGLNDWVRPYWLSSSVDNFWLLMAMRHGLPCLLFLIFALALHIRRILQARDLSGEAAAVRRGYMVTLAGMIFTLATVHIWNELAVFVMFFFGAGAFLYTSRTAAPATDTELPPQGRPARRALPFSRFPSKAEPERAEPERAEPGPVRRGDRTMRRPRP